MAHTEHIHMPEDHMDALYASGNPLVRFVHNIRLDTIVGLMPAGRLRVLDAGCGEGHLIERLHKALPDSAFVGVDVTDVALRKAQQRCPFASFHKGDVLRLPFKDAIFDVVTCTEVIEHIPEYADALKELARVLKPGGLLVITFPNETLWTLARFLLGRRPIRVPDHVNSFSPGSMRRAVPLGYVLKRNLPFRLPFFLSLTCVMVFRK
jgi:2-polyprenyl-3-methyl-5-hydroxy-6-metoxy-1,4-benzoquinol methylase